MRVTQQDYIQAVYYNPPVIIKHFYPQLQIVEEDKVTLSHEVKAADKLKNEKDK